mgnify:CR=1 FL=1
MHSRVALLALCAGLSGHLEAVAATRSNERNGVVYEARVTRVFDGDTLWVRPLTGGRYRKLRLDGMDAPEMCQDGGSAARDALASRVLDRVVTVHVRAHDIYDRGLAQVNMGGEDVAAALVRNGHAWSSRWRQHLGPYAAEEALARTERRGVFETEAAEYPRDFRRRHGPCQTGGAPQTTQPG